MSEPLLDVQAVAQRLAVPVSWVYSAAEAGTIPSYKFGRYRRFRLTEIDAWIESQHQTADSSRQRDKVIPTQKNEPRQAPALMRTAR